MYLETATGLAQRMSDASLNNVEKAIRTGYQIALCREPDKETVEILLELFDTATVELANGPSGSGGYQDPDLDPMAIVASAIMNLDEFVTKE